MTNDHKKASLSIGNGGKNNVQLSATLQPSNPPSSPGLRNISLVSVAPDKAPEEKHHKAVMCMKIARAVLYSEMLQEYIDIKAEIR